MQFRALYDNNHTLWKSDEGSWAFFLDQESAGEVLELAAAEVRALRLDLSNNNGTVPTPPPAPAVPPPDDDPVEELEAIGPPDPPPLSNFGATYQRYTEMDNAARSGLLRENTNRLEELTREEHPDPDVVAEALVSASTDATLTNRAAVNEAIRMGNEQAKAYTDEIVKETRLLVKSTTKLINAELFNEELLNAVVEKSNGTVIQHMTRVFLSGLDFMLYYNRQVLTQGIANHIRIKFPKKYKPFYQSILSHLHEDYVTLERVFLGGMKALDEAELNTYATGFLVHDVGKAEDIEYHEGESAYDRDTVVRHVKIGYKAVMEKTNYPREAALITGYHHEYYGDPAGYGYFREFLDGYKRANPGATQDYVMSYTMEPLLDYEVLSYFPAKMLEIVDVFDSLTDRNRKYRKPLSTDEALEMIQREFIEVHQKVDPILFDIFLDFVEYKKGRVV